MQYLKIDPKILKKKIRNVVDDYNYNCFDLLNDHFDTGIYSDYLNSLIEYKLKTIWNHIVLKWIQSQNELKEDSEYNQSIYSKQKYNHIHRRINQEELNNLINNFINGDKFKGIFAINCIQDHLIKI